MHDVKEYITQAEFCKRLGITEQNLQVAKKRGRVKVEIYNNKKRIEWNENRHKFIETAREPFRYTPTSIIYRKKKSVQKHKQKSGMPEQNYNHPFDLIQEPKDVDGDFRLQMTRIEAEAVKQVYLAKQAKLKFLKDVEIVIESATVKKEWEEIAVKVKKAMLSIPDRVSEVFASITDAEKIHRDLLSEITYALSSLQYKTKTEETNDRINNLIKNESKTPQKQ